jgi:hypothetical protein
MPCHRRGPEVNVAATSPEPSSESTTSSRSCFEAEFPLPLLPIFVLLRFVSPERSARFRDGRSFVNGIVDGVGICT